MLKHNDTKTFTLLSGNFQEPKHNLSLMRAMNLICNIKVENKIRLMMVTFSDCTLISFLNFKSIIVEKGIKTNEGKVFGSDYT